MKKIVVFLLIAIFSLRINYAVSQSEDLLNKRKQAVENLEVFKSTITDTTLDVMKGLVNSQNEVISADKPIIEIYLDSLKAKADSLKRKAGNLANDKEALQKSIDDKGPYYINGYFNLYSLIGIGVFVLLFIVFLVLFLLTSSKKNKFKKQVSGVEDIKQTNIKEIELAKKEVEILKANAKKEIEADKGNVDNEIKNLKAKIDSLNIEKSSMEKRISDKINECTQLQMQLSMVKDECEKKLKGSTSGGIDFTKEKLVLEKEIFEKDLKIDNITKERDIAKQEISGYQNLYEKEAEQRKILEGKLLEKENDVRNIPDTDTGYIDKLNMENQQLKEDLDRLNDKLNKENKAKTMIETELRRLIDELKNIS